ncbi:MAG: hypothetical protein AB1486_14760 [Planctomycetota bacterium]
MKHARVWVAGAALLGMIAALATTNSEAAVVRWSLKEYVEYYDDVWVGEIVSHDLFSANTFGEPLMHTELLLKGYSVVTGKQGYQSVDFLGGGGLSVSTMPPPANTQVGTRVLVFLKAEPQAVARGAMWTSNFTTLLRLEQPRAATEPAVVAVEGSFLDRNRKLSEVEAEILTLWQTVKLSKNGADRNGKRR